MVVFPPCKINLGLSVLAKRADGYHDLETCFYPVPWLDVLEVIPATEFAFTTSGNIIPGASEDNLCVKAYQLLKKSFDLPAIKIHLHKVIPSGAGLGGGSSDAAYTLRLLNERFMLNLPLTVLMEFAAKLGSDCAFFVQDKPMIGTGRGEVLREVSVSLESKFLVIVKPDIHVSTSDAFAGISPGQQLHSIADVVTNRPVEEWKRFLKNDFEESVFKKYPSIRTLKDTLYEKGAVFASMSGTGSAVVGIFEEEVDLSREFPDAIVWAGPAGKRS